MSALEAVRRHQMQALQREETSKQRTGRDWIGGVAVVGTAAATVAALALAARRLKRRDEVGGAHVPSGASDPSGAIEPRGPPLPFDPSGASEQSGAIEPSGPPLPFDPSGASGIAGPALAALHTTRDAMNKAKREMIEASEACLPALITYAERLGMHDAYKEAREKQPSLIEALKEAEADLKEATNAYNALDDRELASGDAYTESVREYGIALAHFRTLVPDDNTADDNTAHTDSENAETHETSGQQGGASEGHRGDAGGETDVKREERAKERAMRDAHKRCVDATVKVARLRGERQALGGISGGDFQAKRVELDGAEKEKKNAEADLVEASDVAYAGAVKETTIQRLQRDAPAPQSKVPGFAPFLAGAANAVTSLLSRETIEGPPVSDSSGWGRARPARERRPCRATRRFL